MDINLVWDPILKVIIAMFLGGLLGLERELAQKPAGLRTHILVAGAACLLMLLGDVLITNYSEAGIFEDAVQADPIRIMEAIITGISFLGAGTIIFRNKDETVEGLTTAASILFVAAIGITVALQRYLLATILTILAILILFGLGFLEGFIARLRLSLFDKDKSND